MTLSKNKSPLIKLAEEQQAKSKEQLKLESDIGELVGTVNSTIDSVVNAIPAPVRAFGKGALQTAGDLAAMSQPVLPGMGAAQKRLQKTAIPVVAPYAAPVVDWLKDKIVSPPLDTKETQTVQIPDAQGQLVEISFPANMPDREIQGVLERNRNTLGLPPVDINPVRQGWNSFWKVGSGAMRSLAEAGATQVYENVADAFDTPPEERQKFYQEVAEQRQRHDTRMASTLPTDEESLQVQNIDGPGSALNFATGHLGGMAGAVAPVVAGSILYPPAAPVLGAAVFGTTAYQDRLDAEVAAGTLLPEAKRKAAISGGVMAILGIAQTGLAMSGVAGKAIIPKAIQEANGAVNRAVAGGIGAGELATFNITAMLTEKTLLGEPWTGMDVVQAGATGVPFGFVMGAAHGFPQPRGYEANRVANERYITENSKLAKENADPARQALLDEMAQTPNFDGPEGLAAEYNKAVALQEYGKDLPEGDPLKVAYTNRLKLVIGLIGNTGKAEKFDPAEYMAEAQRKVRQEAEDGATEAEALSALSPKVPLEERVRKANLKGLAETRASEIAAQNPELLKGKTPPERKAILNGLRDDLVRQATKKGVGLLKPEEILANLDAQEMLQARLAEHVKDSSREEILSEAQVNEAIRPAAERAVDALLQGRGVSPEDRAAMIAIEAKKIRAAEEAQAKADAGVGLTPEEQALVDSHDWSQTDSLLAELDSPTPEKAPLEPQDAPKALPPSSEVQEAHEANLRVTEGVTAPVRAQGVNLPPAKPKAQRASVKKDTLKRLHEALDNSARLVRQDANGTKHPEARVTLLATLTRIQEERPDIMESAKPPQRALQSKVKRLRAEFGTEKLYQKATVEEEPLTPKPRKARPSNQREQETRQFDTFNQALQDAGIDPSILPRKLVLDLVNARRGATVQHVASALLEHTGLGRIEFTTDLDGKPVGELRAENRTGDALRDTGVAARVWSTLNDKVHHAAVEAFGEENVAHARTAAEVAATSPQKLRMEYKADREFGLTGRIVTQVGKAYREAGVAIDPRQLEDIGFMAYVEAKAWLSWHPGLTMEHWFQAHFEPEVAVAARPGEATQAMPRKGLASQVAQPKGKSLTKGWVEFADKKRALIKITQHADASTILHELQHVWRRDLTSKNHNIVAKWLNEESLNPLSAVRKFIDREKAAGHITQDFEYGKLVSRGEDGIWNWTQAADEAFAQMATDIALNKRLGEKGIPSTIRETLTSLRDWLGNILGITNKIAPFKPSKAVRDAYFDLFVPKIQTRPFANVENARLVTKSGVLKVNLTHLVLQDPKVMKAYFDMIHPNLIKNKTTFDELSRAAAEDLRTPEGRHEAVERMGSEIKHFAKDQVTSNMLLSEEIQAFMADLDGATSARERADVTNKIRNGHYQYFQLASNMSHAAGAALAARRMDSRLIHEFSGIALLERSLTKSEMGRLRQMMEAFQKGDEEGMAQAQALMHATPLAHVRSAIASIVYNGLLSTVRTLTNNPLVNTLWFGWDAGFNRLATAGLQSVVRPLTGRQRSVFLEEVVPLLTAGWRDAPHKFALSLEVLTTGKTPKEFSHLGHSKYEEPTTSKSTQQYLGFHALAQSKNKTARVVAGAFETVTRIMRMMDLFAQSVAFDGHMAALEARKGALEKSYGRGAGDRYTVEAMRDEAKRYARYATFTDKPGALTQLVLQFKDAAPEVGFFTYPFVSTLVNTTKDGVAMLPGVGLAAEAINRANPKSVKEKMYLGPEGTWKGDAESMVAKQIGGAILGYLLWQGFANGSLVGSRPKDQDEATAFDRANKVENSILVNGRYFSFANLGPFAVPLKLTAEAYDRVHSYYRDERIHNEGGKAEASVAKEVSQTIDNMKAFLIDNVGLKGFIKNFEGPKRGDDPVASKGHTVAKYASMLVPFSGFLRELGVMIETHQTGGYMTRPDVNSTLADMGLTVLPISAQFWEHPTKVDIWGEPQKVTAKDMWSFWLPMRSARGAVGDPVEMELQRLMERGVGGYPKMPDKVVSLYPKSPGVEIPPDLYRQFALETGKLSKAAVANLMKSPQYQGLPQTRQGDLARAAAIANNYGAAHEGGLAKVKAEMRKLGLGKAESGVPMR